MYTPWGKADHVKWIAPGITRVDTSSHGGYKVEPMQEQAIRAKFPNMRPFAGWGWYEEDCDWAYVALTYPNLFPPEAQEAAKASMAWQEEYHQSLRQKAGA